MCNCNTTPECQEPVNCGCKTFLDSSCVNNVDVDLQCSNILKGQTLSEVLVLLDEYICTKFDSVTNFFELINIGAGSQVYKGVSMLGKKEIRTLVDSGLINLVQGTNDITISVDEAALNTFIEANQKTYSAANIGTGASIYKDTTVVGDNTQFNLRKIKSSNSSVTITEGTNDIDITVVAGAVPDGSETKVTAGANVTVTGTGTIATPYIVNGQYAPLERIDEGNGNGYTIRGRNATYYGNVGLDAVDLSYSTAESSVLGATGESSFAQGVDVVASGYGAVVFGEDIDNNGTLSAVFGKGGVITDGYGNLLTGGFNEVTSGAYATVVGQVAEVVVNNIADINADSNVMFAVGNGTVDGGGLPLVRSTALKVLQSGLVTIPKQTTALIESNDKAAVTKEYLYLQKIITYPADFTGTNYTITNSDMGYSIIIVNEATAVTITVPAGLQSKMQVGFIQDGTADVTITPSGTTLKNSISGYKIKGQYDQVYLEQGAVNTEYYLLGNTKI